MTRELRTLIVLAVALVAALAASYFAYLGMQRMALNAAGPSTVPVVVAAREIPLGSLITREHVKLVDWPAGSQVTGAITSIDEAVDRGAVMAIAVSGVNSEARPTTVQPAASAAAQARAGL